MKKNWSLLNSYILTQLTFRSEQWLWFILDSLPLAILLFVWSSVFQSTDSIQDFTLSDLVFYYLLTALLIMLTASHFEEWRVNEIREGKIDKYLIQPVGYIKHILAGFMSGKIVFALLNLPVFLLFTYFCTLIFDITLPSLTFSNIIPMIILIGFAFIFNFCLALMIVLLGFWLENAENLEHFKWLLVSLLSGQILPIDLMPETLQKITWALPFKYLIGIPGMVALNKYDLVIFDYLYMLVTLGLSTLLLAFIWHKAKYKYSSIGG